MPRNNPTTATMKPTELWHVPAVSNNIASIHRQLTVSNTVILAHDSTIGNDLSIVTYEQHQGQNN